MYSKLSVAFFAALAVVAQAAYDHHGHDHFHKNGTHSFSFPTGSGFPVPSGLVPPFSTGGSPSQLPASAPYPTGTGSSPSGAPSGAPISSGFPVPTGAPISSGASGAGSSPSSASGAGESGDTTLTYTIGTGSSTTVMYVTSESLVLNPELRDISRDQTYCLETHATSLPYKMNFWKALLTLRSMTEPPPFTARCTRRPPQPPRLQAKAAPRKALQASRQLPTKPSRAPFTCHPPPAAMLRVEPPVPLALVEADVRLKLLSL